MIATALTEMFGRAHLNRATGSTESLAQYLKAIWTPRMMADAA